MIKKVNFTVPRPHVSVSPHIPVKLALVIGAIGVVYGDIGTSPLYAVNEIFFGVGHTQVTRPNVLGAIGMIFWLLTLVVSIKYVIYILKANYQGEGGVIALHELVASLKRPTTPILLLLLLFAAALLIGEGIITPAISVLAAVEGLKVATSFFEPAIVPISAGILTGLFLIQRFGTHKVGRLFGPITATWFISIGAVGLMQILAHTSILAALNPVYAIKFALSMNIHNLFITLGSVTLAVTGAAALYADLGHFGKVPIRQGWFYLAYWALILNYLGQGAYLLSGQPVANQNIFFSLLPELQLPAGWLAQLPAWGAHLLPRLPLYAMLMLAAAAAVIASQALITGAFSLASQAIALKISPRLNIIHTNARLEGQIYLPAVNWFLYIGCMLLVLVFKSSTNLAAAYGLAVTGVMLATTAAMIHVVRYRWHWSIWRTAAIFGVFLLIDAMLFAANSLKFFTGGYVPITIGVILFAFVLFWKWGRRFVKTAYLGYVSYASPKDMAWLVNIKKRLSQNHELSDRPRRLVQLDRSVVFLVSQPIDTLASSVPIIVRIFMKRQGALPRHLVLLHIVQEKVPFVHQRDSINVADLGENIFIVKAHFGFMQRPDGLKVLQSLKKHHYMGDDLHRCTVEASDEEFFIYPNAKRIDRLRLKVYRLFSRITPPAYHYFGLDAKPGLSKTVVPIILGNDGWRIDIPEFALDPGEERIDPDTLEPTDLRFGRKYSPDSA
jgi:KUP system potassium uptake protein